MSKPSRLPKDSAQQHLLLELQIQEPFENSIGLNQSSAKATNGNGDQRRFGSREDIR